MKTFLKLFLYVYFCLFLLLLFLVLFYLVRCPKLLYYYELAVTGDPDAALLDDNDEDVGDEADEVPITTLLSCVDMLI